MSLKFPRVFFNRPFRSPYLLAGIVYATLVIAVVSTLLSINPVTVNVQAKCFENCPPPPPKQPPHPPRHDPQTEHNMPEFQSGLPVALIALGLTVYLLRRRTPKNTS